MNAFWIAPGMSDFSDFSWRAWNQNLEVLSNSEGEEARWRLGPNTCSCVRGVVKGKEGWAHKGWVDECYVELDFRLVLFDELLDGFEIPVSGVPDTRT